MMSDLYIKLYFSEFFSNELVHNFKKSNVQMVTLANIAGWCIGKFLRVNPGDFHHKEKIFFLFSPFLFILSI